MKHGLLILAAIAALGAASPATAMSFQVDLPTLTFPPQPEPDSSQSCTDVVKLNGVSCEKSSA